MGFRQLKTAALAASKTTQQEPEEVAVEVETPVKASTPAKKVASTALSFLPTTSALSAVLAELDQASVVSAIPLVYISGGAAGGAFTPSGALPDEIAVQLPQGKKPIAGVLLGFRVEVVSWPVGFNDRTDEAQKPSWSCRVPSTDPEGIKRLLRLTKKRQYTPAAQKQEWDFAASGCGQVTPQLQILVYVPELENAIAVASTAHYISCLESLRALDSLAAELSTMPVLLTPSTEFVSIKGNKVAQHHIAASPDVSKRGKDAMASFQEWVASLSDEDKADITSWFETDISATAEAGIEAGLALVL